MYRLSASFKRMLSCSMSKDILFFSLPIFCICNCKSFIVLTFSSSIRALLCSAERRCFVSNLGSIDESVIVITVLCSSDRSAVITLSGITYSGITYSVSTFVILGVTFTSFIIVSVSYTHLRAHETPEHLVCRLLLEK